MKSKLLSILILSITLNVVDAAEKDLLIIESYHAEYPWDASYVNGINKAFEDSGYKIHRFQMDTKRVPKTEYQKKADEAWQFYQGIQPKLVFLGDDNALKFLADKLGATKTPVVYLGINSNPRRMKLSNNITGVLERPLFKKSVVEIKKIMPKAKKILILFDSGNTSKHAVEEAFKGKTSLKIAGVQLELKQISKKDLWESTVHASKNDGFDSIIIGLYHTLVDDKNNSVNAETLINWTSKNTPIPLFAFWSFTVGPDKAIGGLVLEGYSQGEKAAEIAKRILNGDSPSNIRPAIGEKGKFLFSKKLLEKWSLTLPNDINSKAEYID
ncbi:ABC transporter substrate-binding protein [Spartinivicinus poritis]|uniref:ABC transporter substrate binding protein n=1 Tax=Spartinivicinus poritis TaxID=2994640 RepID=A0ABT5UD50_9GAMM|nr:ABC transporter substrate binding protein [Spartinivicinus sp. A2-2]MDE1464306.1 ABC transporter substrate binding protein [Spartinivicinus sp. A2-2]